MFLNVCGQAKNIYYSIKNLAGIFIIIFKTIITWRKLTSLFCWICHSIHTMWFFICLELLWSTFCTFQYTCFVRFTLKKFILWAIINCIVFLISVSKCSLLVYKSITYFWLFIFCPVILLNSTHLLVLEDIFVGRFLGVFYVDKHVIYK